MLLLVFNGCDISAEVLFCDGANEDEKVQQIILSLLLSPIPFSVFEKLFHQSKSKKKKTSYRQFTLWEN